MCPGVCFVSPFVSPWCGFCGAPRNPFSRKVSCFWPFDTLVEVLKSLSLGFNLVALIALNLAFPPSVELKFPGSAYLIHTGLIITIMP